MQRSDNAQTNHKNEGPLLFFGARARDLGGALITLLVTCVIRPRDGEESGKLGGVVGRMGEGKKEDSKTVLIVLFYKVQHFLSSNPSSFPPFGLIVRLLLLFLLFVRLLTLGCILLCGWRNRGRRRRRSGRVIAHFGCESGLKGERRAAGQSRENGHFCLAES